MSIYVLTAQGDSPRANSPEYALFDLAARSLEVREAYGRAVNDLVLAGDTILNDTQLDGDHTAPDQGRLAVNAVNQYRRASNSVARYGGAISSVNAEFSERFQNNLVIVGHIHTGPQPKYPDAIRIAVPGNALPSVFRSYFGFKGRLTDISGLDRAEVGLSPRRRLTNMFVLNKIVSLVTPDGEPKVEVRFL